MVNHILVAIDGSDPAREAAYFARDLAHQTSAHLTLLVAIQPPSAYAIPPFDAMAFSAAHPDPEHLAAAQALMDALEQELGHDKVSTQATVGMPAETICAEAARLDVDLIVVGARGKSGTLAALGSVSQKVVREAERPVLVVR